MKFLNKLKQSTRRQFMAASAVLVFMLGALLSPLIPARIWGTPVQLTYQSGYVEPQMTIYPVLTIDSLAKDELPCVLNAIFYSSETEAQAVQQLNEIDQFYLIVEPVEGNLKVTNVMTSRPTTGLYLISNYAYFQYNRMGQESSNVWQDQYSGIGFSVSNGLTVYVPRDLSNTTKQAIVDGTAVMNATLYNGQLYFIDFNL